MTRIGGLALAIGGALATGAALTAPAAAQTVADRALSDIKAETAGGCSALTVNFNIRVQIVSWFPETAGRELHVRLLPLDGTSPTQLRDSLRTPGAVPALRSVQYEGDNPAGPILSLFFTRDMQFGVEAGATPQQLVIRVSNPGSAACTAPAAPVAGAPAAAPLSGSQADQAEAARLIGEAEQAIRESNLDRAIPLLTNAAALPETASTPRALELLGLARERKGQAAHATAIYEEYLRRFPEGEAAERVRQRLASLAPAPGASQQLHAGNGGAGTAKAWTFGLRGSFSQFYFRDQGRTSTFTTSSTLGTEVDNSVNVNQLLTAGDVTLTAGNDRRQFQLRAAGSYTKNFGTSASVSTINNGNQTLTFRSRPGGGIEALTALYLDYADADLDTSLRIGRQTRNSAGVLGRYDGALLGFQANPHLKVNAVAGFPVLSSHQMSVLKERPFYGLSVDFGAKRSPLQASVYWFDQRAKGGFIDRRSLGVEARLLKKRFNAYAMADYDVKFGRLNLGLMSFNYNFPDASSLSLTADYRQSPLLTTTNALIAQIDLVTNLPILTLGGLRPFFTDDQIYQLARDRTLTSKSMTLTYSRPITSKLQISADFNMTDTGGTPPTPASAGTMAVGALPATGKEFYYGTQLIGSGLLWDNDIYILAGRYSNTAMARVWTADFNARVPITGKFRVSPRLRYGYRDNKPSAATPVPGTYRQFQPTLRMNYYPIRHSEIEVELGGNFTSQSQYNGASWDRIREQGWVLSSGYRLDF
ncbi:tol-pal system YbgF family protein [Novosphingobium bradum]|uniref:Tol-pal system YbgF family protein n=1 Tax=Novosphingobium bradum TaxID=1737444 RepID=A0ABV7IPW3_9SPHN